MFVKKRFESKELKILRSLNSRMTLPEKVKKYYHTLEKGFEGEQIFDKWLNELPSGYLIINDLLLEHHNTYFQIDSLVISEEKIYLFDVKNFEGDYYIDLARWYKLSSREEVKNPLHQLDRCKTMLRTFLQKSYPDIPIEAYLVFVNPEFTLFQAPLDAPMVLPTQIKRFLANLKFTSVNPSGGNLKLAELLISKNLSESPFARLPKYEYSELKKGITCLACSSLSTSMDQPNCICEDCGYKENTDIAILRSIEEYKFLFPEGKMTTNIIYDWCGKVKSLKAIRRILLKEYKKEGHGKYSYYI